MPTSSAGETLRARIRREVPEHPGVYTWLGESGEPLYTGKSVDLRKRMLSYLAPGRGGPGDRMRHLVSSLRDFELQETPGELAALLLEDLRIKQLGPRYNVRQRDYRERRYLLLTDDPYPTCLIVECAGSRGGVLYGPYKDQYFVEGLIALITDEFGLRGCSDAQPHRRSARFDLGRCPGPCRGAISERDYGVRSERVRAFLCGDGEWIAATLSAEMDTAAEALRFEEAAVAKERLAFCARFTARQRFIQAFREGPMVVAEPEFGLSYRFDRGLLTAVEGAPGGRWSGAAALALPVEDPRFMLDRANLVYGWQRKSPNTSFSGGSGES